MSDQPLVNPESPYTSYSSWLRARYGEPVYKISLDGGF
ncbi:MAG: TIGR01212 family radical SAM protein, partial [Spirochaetia bacterium]|nr:TIGR01212 family radical SAM protein [Spirochaetia bacterium]